MPKGFNIIYVKIGQKLFISINDKYIFLFYSQTEIQPFFPASVLEQAHNYFKYPFKKITQFWRQNSVNQKFECI